VPGICAVPEAAAEFSCATGSAPDRQTMQETCSNQAFFESSLFSAPLIIRSRLPGDRYGGPGHRKVKKMLIDRKIPLSERLLLPMIAVGSDVVWIPGFRPARSFEAHPGSAACVIIRMHKT
jgi:tRNA(Ile)-lysidine synthase